MSTVAGAGRGAQRGARQAARSDFLTRIGRVGLVGYGLVNLMIAFLVAKIALGGSGEQANKSGALGTVADQPFGKALLWVVGIALIALALWEASEAIWGYASAGKHRLKKRITSGSKAVLFAFLAFNAIKFASGSGKSGSQTKTVTGKLLEQPFGQVLVVILGLAVVVVAAFVVKHGITKEFREDLDLSRASAKTQAAAVRLGQVGYAALGLAYGLVGVLIVYAAVSYDPEKASGFDGAMKTIADQPFGSVLLWLVALGITCYGVYCFFDARFRKS
jgi:sulfite exporter TauE/SafE